MITKEKFSEKFNKFMDEFDLSIIDNTIYRNDQSFGIKLKLDQNLAIPEIIKEIESIIVQDILIKLFNEKFEDKMILPFNVETKNNRIYKEESFEKPIDKVNLFENEDRSNPFGSGILNYKEDGVYIKSIILYPFKIKFDILKQIIKEDFSPYLTGEGRYCPDQITIENYIPTGVCFCKTKERSF